MSQLNQVHAPYHFVPLSKWVYMPDWAHIVSHDVPFKDGISGVLEYTLSNATPLCVGGKQTKANDNSSEVKWARDPIGNPVIPGSSLKGMLRSVLEIATFGKFSAIDDNHFSYRDVSSKSHYLEKVIKQNNTTAAWLKYDSNTQNWTLHGCKFAKIKHAESNQALQLGLKNTQTAVEKYQQQPLSRTIKMEVFQKESKTQGMVNWVKDIGQGSTEGHLVFCNNRILGSKTAKPEDYEFSYCFFGEHKAIKIDSNELNALANSLFASHDEKHVAYIQKHPHPQFGIPVFALIGKQDNKVNALGLAKMPRVLYKNAASDLAQAQQGNAQNSQHYFDLAELMFGTLREKGLGLKSRVFFADATLNSSKGLYTSNNVTLNGPKATFNGAYLEQPKAGHYQDYDDGKSKLSGWKRYITAQKFSENPNSSDNSNVQAKIELLASHSQFSGRVVFHNLKQEELGALIWALQLGTREQSTLTYHGLGHGKSLGAGAVQLSLDKTTLNANDGRELGQGAEHFVSVFIEHMQNKYPGGNTVSWQDSPQVQHLQAMANMQENRDRDLSYHPLGEYKIIKNNKASLAAIEVKGEALTRQESSLITASGALSFGQGRLAALFSDADKGDTWLTNEKAKQESLQQAVIDAHAEAEKQQREVIEAARLANLPEEFSWIAELQAKLFNALTVDDKRQLNPQVETLIARFMAQTFDKVAAQELYNLVNNKNHCEYLKVTDKKKLNPRKAKLVELAAKYNLITG